MDFQSDYVCQCYFIRCSKCIILVGYVNNGGSYVCMAVESHICIASPTITAPHQNCAFVIINKSAWACPYYESLHFILGLTLVYSMGFDKCIMKFIHYYNIIQNSFTVLKIFCAFNFCAPSSFLFSVE